MKLTIAGAFVLSFAIGFIISFIFGFGLSSILGGVLGLSGLIGLTLGIVNGIQTGIAGVIIFYLWRTISRNQQLTLAAILLVIGLLIFPPIDAIAIVGFLFTFLGTKKGR